MDKKTKIIILAGGKGTRMKEKLPKALVPLKGRPMIEHLILSVSNSGVDDKPAIVVGYEKEKVISVLGKDYDYVVQEEQLGTGHAVMSAENLLQDKADNVLVLYCDHPFVSASTIKKLRDKHLESGGKITMATIKLPDFQDWRATFYTSFSRIVRDENSKIIKDVQFRDASDEEKKITEVNPCYFCFDAKWLWSNLKKIKNDNDQKQYYLTDLVKIAMEEGLKIESISIEPREGLAVNSKEELEILNRFAVG